MKRYQILAKDKALALAKSVSQKQWKVGKARTAALTGTVKKNEEILEDSSLDMIGKLIVGNPDIQLEFMPYKIFKPKYSRYTEGSSYALHTDAPWMGGTRTDLSCTLFLSENYDGGELVVDGVVVVGEPGEAVVYECGRPHEVLPVTNGERICAVTWIQSRIRSPQKRKIVSDLRKAMVKVSDDPAFSRVHSALLRMWSET